MMTPGHTIGMFIESGGRNAMNFTAANVTRPVAPTMMLNVRRRDSHHRKMLAVFRTSAGAGKSKRVRADTAALRAIDRGKIQPATPPIKYFMVQRGSPAGLELFGDCTVSCSTSSLAHRDPRRA